MPEYLSPGVYIEEINSGPRPIEGVSTSTAGFAGETERGSQKPTLVTSWSDFLRSFGGYIDQPPFNTTNVYLPYAIRGFFENGGQRAYIARVVGAAATTAAGPLPGNATTVQAVGPGAWGNNIRISIEPASASLAMASGATGAAKTWFRLRVLYYRNGVPATLIDPKDPDKRALAQAPDALEDFDNLTHDSTKPNYALGVINGSSCLIKIITCTAPPTAKSFAEGGVALTGTAGKDAAAVLGDFTKANTDPEERTGLDGLLTVRDVSLMICPDDIVVPELGSALVDRCESTRDRFAILNEVTDKTDWAAIAQHRDSSYAALYYPRLRVVAPHTPEGYAVVPSSGHIAGIYARTDVDRGVHKAPANEVVRGILSRDLSGGRKPLSHTLTKREQDMLNPQGVNVIRDFRPDGRDIRAWGARTMTSDSQWKYINVRRLFIFIEESIDRGTQWVVFEPNAEITWISLRASIENFLSTVWRNGALMGTTPEEAFFVRCDRTTMTQDDFDNGRLICVIGIAPVKPAEFVIFRISQKTVDSQS